jgi:CBS domain protein
VRSFCLDLRRAAMEADTPLHEIAALLQKNFIERVPIVDNEQLVGIVSRANVINARCASVPSPRLSRYCYGSRSGGGGTALAPLNNVALYVQRHHVECHTK